MRTKYNACIIFFGTATIFVTVAAFLRVSYSLAIMISLLLSSAEKKQASAMRANKYYVYGLRKYVSLRSYFSNFRWKNKMKNQKY